MPVVNQFDEKRILNAYDVVDTHSVRIFDSYNEIQTVSKMEQIGEGFFSKVFKRDATTIVKKTSIVNIIELDVLFRIHHPNIIHGIDFYFEDDVLCIVMPYLPQDPDPNMLDPHIYLLQLTEAVNHLHSQHIYHRDIRRSNIIISDKQLYLIDFGMAQTNHIQLGTSDYVRSDIFNMACLFVYILTGQEIFSFEDVDNINENISNFVKDIPNNLMNYGLNSEDYELILRMFVDRNCNTSNIFIESVPLSHRIKDSYNISIPPQVSDVCTNTNMCIQEIINICTQNNFHISILFFSIDIFYRIISVIQSMDIKDVVVVALRFAMKILYNFTPPDPDPYKKIERICIKALQGKLLYDNYYTMSETMNQLIFVYPYLFDPNQYMKPISTNVPELLLGCSKDIHCEQFYLNMNTRQT